MPDSGAGRAGQGNTNVNDPDGPRCACATCWPDGIAQGDPNITCIYACGATIGKAVCTQPAGHTGNHMTNPGMDRVVWARGASDATCGRCGQLAKGYAAIDGVRYCHEGADPTCYMRASWEKAEKLIPAEYRPHGSRCRCHPVDRRCRGCGGEITAEHCYGCHPEACEQIAAMRPVVTAAIAYADAGLWDGLGKDMDVKQEKWAALRDATDAYRGFGGSDG